MGRAYKRCVGYMDMCKSFQYAPHGCRSISICSWRWFYPPNSKSWRSWKAFSILYNETYFYFTHHFVSQFSNGGFVFFEVILLCNAWELNREWKSNKAKAITESGQKWEMREWGREDESKREDEDAAVNSRTLGNESAALVMKWNDRESLRGWREGDGEDSRSWNHDGDERYFSRVGVGCLSAANAV